MPGTVGPADTVLLVSLPYGDPLVALVDRPLEGPVTTGTVLFEVEIPVVNVTDDETVVEEVVLFTAGIFEPVEDVEDTPEELVEDTVEVLELSLVDVVEGATLLLLELLGASLILRAPLMLLLEVGLPSFFFM